eukprot:CAMPEP_0119186578 /NCGR_PEP_ID=MMETSP1315-20130426/69089_1 /TAXON_ID=676789 /ORGANISM="Prasinoderma singularis, Strain RCC927" /LENGTH=335 /DNA_ID=CAMNT_0007181015 /DNA_START=1 /DNA_END=1006 /DNA_ORIENTATION=+
MSSPPVAVPAAFASSSPLVASRAQYDALYARSVADPAAFWGEIAEGFHWDRKYESVTAPDDNFDVQKGRIQTRWFVGGTTNLCYNAVDRHVKDGKGDKVAFYWEGNDVGEQSVMTYSDVQAAVCRLANHLRSLGVKKGDRVVIYLPMICELPIAMLALHASAKKGDRVVIYLPMICELPIAMLACARIGAIHSVVFGGFSADALASRIEDSQSTVLLTCSAVKRGGKSIGLKKIADDAMAKCEAAGKPVAHCLCYDNARAAPDRATVGFKEGRDAWWQDAVAKQSDQCAVEWVDAEDPSFMLYTSGSTGKPKGVLHTTGGYMVYSATTFKYVFDW